MPPSEEWQLQALLETPPKAHPIQPRTRSCPAQPEPTLGSADPRRRPARTHTSRTPWRLPHHNNGNTITRFRVLPGSDVSIAPVSVAGRPRGGSSAVVKGGPVPPSFAPRVPRQVLLNGACQRAAPPPPAWRGSGLALVLRRFSLCGAGGWLVPRQAASSVRCQWDS